MLKGSWRVVGVLSIISGAISFALLLSHAFHFGWHPAFQILVDFYETLRDLVLRPLLPLALWFQMIFSSFFELDAELGENWKDLFVTLSLYFGARSKSYWDTGQRSHAIFRILLGFPISLVSSVAASLWKDDTIGNCIGFGSSIIVGMLFYELIASAFGSVFYRKKGQSFFQEFFRYLNYSFPALLLALFLLFISITGGAYISNEYRNEFGLIGIILFLLIVPFYWAWRGWTFAGHRKNRQMGETRWERFQSSSATRIAKLMLYSVGGGLLFALMGAGFNVLSK